MKNTVYLSYLSLLIGSALSVTTLPTTFAFAGDGANSGGGGDANEMPVDSIRGELLRWISSDEEGGARNLELPSRLTFDQYRKEMTAVLLPHAVVIDSVTNVEEQAEEARPTPDPEKIVKVNGNTKMCRGFKSLNGLLHLLCNSDRVKGTPPSEQFRLIHHEYAGLAGVEQNVGASSDYEISNQLSAYGKFVSIWQLGPKWAKSPKDPNSKYTRTYNGACGRFSRQGSFIEEVDPSLCQDLYVYWTRANSCLEVEKRPYQAVLGMSFESDTRGILPIFVIGGYGYYESRQVDTRHCSSENSYFINPIKLIEASRLESPAESKVDPTEPVKHALGGLAFECSKWGWFKFPAAKVCARRMAKSYCEKKSKKAEIVSTQADGFLPERGSAFAKAVVQFECI